MSIWRPTAAKLEPETELSHWQILHDPESNEYYFSGWTGYEGRHSSKIVEFDFQTLSGRTRSGRIYRLINGYRGWNADVAYVVRRWQRINFCDSVVVNPEDVKI